MITIFSNQWFDDRQGFFDADTAEHCGGDLSRLMAFYSFIADLATGWTAQ